MKLYNNKQPRKFAWGCNVWGESVCPSLAAFPTPPGGTMRLYGDPALYDHLVQSFLGERDDAQGEVEEAIAKEKWLSALFEMKQVSYPDDYHLKLVEEHTLVAEKLGWLKREQNEKEGVHK